MPVTALVTWRTNLGVAAIALCGGSIGAITRAGTESQSPVQVQPGPDQKQLPEGGRYEKHDCESRLIGDAADGASLQRGYAESATGQRRHERDERGGTR